MSASIDSQSHTLLAFNFFHSDYDQIGFEQYSDFVTDTVLYSIRSNGKKMASNSDGVYLRQWRCHNCGDGWGGGGGEGWITFGGAQPPATVQFQDIMGQFRVINLQDHKVQFVCPQRFDMLRIFDLLGRECDRVAIPAGAESVDYNTSRLSPGLYIAQLGQQAVKFVVR